MTHISSPEPLPSSIEMYREGILSVLPREWEKDSIASVLADKLDGWKPNEVYPADNESLCLWLSDSHNGSDPVKLMLIVGESHGKNRLDRSQRRAGDRKMTAAATCDGVCAAEAVVEIIRSLEQVDFKGVVDEWPVAADEVDKRHLVVIGTGEVNIFGMFLHGLVNDLFFGDRIWPPNPGKLGDQLEVAGDIFHRNPMANIVKDYGAVILLKNPWNQNFRLLWIAGLTGYATTNGCFQIASNWGDYHEIATRAVGVVFHVEREGECGIVVPEAWLMRTGNEITWEKKPRLPIDTSPHLPVDPVLQNKPVRLFIAYSHEDESLRNDLCTHLKVLQRQKLIEIWYDRKIDPGGEWKREIDANLKVADIILLLVSAQFIASDYCYEEEMQRALERHNKGEARVIPIILRDALWDNTPIGKLQALPQNGIAVKKWRDKNEAWLNVSKGIERIIIELSASK